MNKKIGFIGCGKMASAIIKGILNSCCKPNVEIKGSEVNCEIAELAQEKLGITVLSDNRALAIDSDVIFIATKPNYVQNVLEEIKSELTDLIDTIKKKNKQKLINQKKKHVEEMKEVLLKYKQVKEQLKAQQEIINKKENS